MIHFNKFFLASAAAATMVTGFAHAASAPVAGDGVAASADVVFSEPDQISHTLTPVANLFAGQHKMMDKVAHGMIHSLDGHAHNYVVRFTGADSLSIADWYFMPSAVYKGKNNPENTINVMFTIKYLDSYAIQQYMDTDNYGVVLTNEMSKDFGDLVPVKTVNYDISLATDQDVKADTYTISTIAYEYAG